MYWEGKILAAIDFVPVLSEHFATSPRYRLSSQTYSELTVAALNVSCLLFSLFLHVHVE